nr:hypothetical protein [Herbaspirillum sp. ASV7]
MKQDKELLKKILLTMVESDDIHLDSLQVHTLLRAKISSLQIVSYHLQLLEDDGYVILEGTGPTAGYRVTSQGQARYEWYESNRDPFAFA